MDDDRVADLSADQRLSQRRFVGNLVLVNVRFGSSHEFVFDFLRVAVFVENGNFHADGNHVFLARLDNLGDFEFGFDFDYLALDTSLFVFSRVVFGVFG